MQSYSNESNEQLQLVLCNLFQSFENGLLLTALFETNWQQND